LSPKKKSGGRRQNRQRPGASAPPKPKAPSSRGRPPKGWPEKPRTSQKKDESKPDAKRPEQKRSEKKTRLSGDFVVGRHPVRAVLEHQAPWAKRLRILKDGKGLEAIVALAEKAGIEILREGREKLDGRVGPGLVHQGVVLEVSPFPYVAIEDALDGKPDLIVVLDGVEDPRNLGAIARAAVSFGARLMVVPAHRAARVTASAHKAAAGALALIDVAVVENLARALDQMKDAGFWIVGAEADGEIAPSAIDLKAPTAWVIGGEDRGLRRLTRERCDHVAAIPMSSPHIMLNAADAATVLLYETARQRS
jgi:23S rRNA (guanosine2251-2'-O)-methyltransferase